MVSRTGGARLGDGVAVAIAAWSAKMMTGAANDMGWPVCPVPTTWTL